MLQLASPTGARVTISTTDGIHAVATEIPHGQDFDPESLTAYGNFSIISIETFPPAYTMTAYFEHICDLDPWEWEIGQHKTLVISFPHETGKLTKAELTRLKAAHTGYRLIWLCADVQSTAAPEF